MRPLAVVGLFVVMQLVPYRVGNPKVVAEPNWDSPETRALTVRACYGCHSNETEKPWYAYVAPMAWLVNNHVEGGREELNFSEWTGGQAREPKLTPGETDALIAVLLKTMSASQ